MSLIQRLSKTNYIVCKYLSILFSGKDCGFPGRPGNGTTIGAEKFFYPGEEVIMP